MKKLDKRLLGLIKHTKGQFIAIAVVVAVGLMIYMSMSSAAINLQDTLDDYYQLTNFADIFVQVVKIPEKDIPQLLSKYDFLDIEDRIVLDAPMITEDENERATIRIVSITDEDRINSLYYVKGNPIRDKDHDVVLVEQFARARGIDVGDSIKFQLNGRQYKMNVRGIAASPEYIYLIENEQNMLPDESKFGVVFVSKEFAQQSSGLIGSGNEVVIRLKDGQDHSVVEKDIEKGFEKYGLKRIIRRENQLSNRMISEELTQLRNASGSVPILFLCIAGTVLIMMISRMVKKDRASIGVLKALGYKSSQIIVHYTKYALSAGFLGVLAGTILGALIAGGMTKIYIDFFNIPILKINFYMIYVAWSVLFTGIFCGFSGIFGAKGILKIMPAESMRPEAPKSGKRIWLENIKFLWRRLSFSWKLIIKNALRNKKRMAFVLFGVILTCSLMVATLNLVNSTISIFDEYFSEFQKMDYNINFNTPLNKNVTKEISHIADIEHIEPKIEFPFEMRFGLRKKIVNIIGINRDTRFYDFRNLQGDKTYVSVKGLLITENLAKEMGASKGDTIRLHSFIPDRKDIYIQVADIITQGLGMNAYMEIDHMADSLLDEQLVTGVYLDSKDSELVSKLISADHISTIQSTQDMMDVFQEFMGLTIMSIGIIVVMAGILGFSIVYNATIVSLGEREMEFSSMRVLGFTKNEIFSVVLRENMIITIAGIILGIPFGHVMGRALGNMYSNEIYTLKITGSLKTDILACIFTLIFIALSQLATFRKITKLNFLMALKNRIS